MKRRTTELRVLRVGLGIPQYELAEAARIDPGRLSKIERGIEAPTAEEEGRILDALGRDAKLVLPAVTKILDWLRGNWPGAGDEDGPGTGRAA